jgi:hypothetical protein
MEDLETLKQQIKHGEEIKLSSDFTTSGVILGLIVGLLGSAVLFSKIFNNLVDFKANILFAGVLMIVLLLLVLYQAAYAVTAKLEGKQLILKKVLGGRTELDVQQVHKISTFALKSTKYTNIKYTDSSGNTGRALIMNSNSLLFGREVSAGEIIKLAQAL